MNWFRNKVSHTVNFALLTFLFLFLSTGLTTAQTVDAEATDNTPILEHGGIIYADIDSVNRQLHLIVGDNWWKYDLVSNRWQVVDSLSLNPEVLWDLEFGYNPAEQNVEMWSRGVGKYFVYDKEVKRFRRIDKSHNHRNQFGHFPFFKKGSLYTFGGYGYWEWHNILTFFNRDVREWHIQNIDPASTLPEKRNPFTGHYRAESDELFIFGGHTTKRQHPDDMRASRIHRKDIWKLSFADQAWKKVLELDQQDLHFYSPPASGKIGRTNKISSSVYIPEMGYWFIPVVYSQKLEDPYYLKPLNLKSQTAHPTIELQLGKSKQFLPTNFFYDAAGQSVVIVGIDYLTNTKEYPVRIFRIPKDSLSSQIHKKGLLASVSRYFYGMVLLGLLLAIVIFFFLKNQSLKEVESSNLPLTKSNLGNIDIFSDQEKKLIQYLIAQEDPVEPHAIEELLWEEVDSYDYRRRLRNDLIKSVNRKFQSLSSEDIKLIRRTKDPNDNRKFLYGINRSFVA